MSSGSNVQTSEWTIGRLLNWTTDYLARNGVEEARLSAELLLAASAECRRIDLYARFERTLPEVQLARFRDMVKRAARHEPIAYLVGEKEFFSLPFYVTPDVLIPRAETETIVEACVDFCHTRSAIPQPKPKTHNDAALPAQSDCASAVDATGICPVGAPLATVRLLDIGTGSGCIIVACLANLPVSEAIASDISQAALDIARKNAERHGVIDRLKLIQADRFGLPNDVLADRFDVIVCNPPYVPAAEVPRLHPGVRDFEPRIALTDEADGLSFYAHLPAQASSLLRAGGRIFVEVGDNQVSAVTEIMTDSGALTRIALRRDRVTGRERVLGFAATGT